MAITAKVDHEEQSLVISIIGRFDFSSHHDFRQCYENIDSKPIKVQVNMKQATFVDSSALGMLLILRDFVTPHCSKIEILGCNQEVRAILEMANFDDLFDIH